MANVKFSDFLDGPIVQAQIGDIMVGLRSGVNYKFEFPSTGIYDANGNKLLAWATAGAAVENNIKITSALGSAPPIISVEGTTDPNIDMDIQTQGTGGVMINSTVAIDSIIDDDTMVSASDSNLSTSEAIVAYIATVPGAAGGSNTQMQYNNAGTLDGDSGCTTDGAGSVNIIGDLDVDNININGNSIISTNAAGNINITPNTTGDLVLDGLKWPQADGTANQAITTNAAAQLGWSTVSTVTTPTTDNAIARYDGVSGALQDSTVTIDDSGNFTGTDSTALFKWNTSTTATNTNVLFNTNGSGNHIFGITNNMTTATNKIMRFGVPHYTNTEEPLLCMHSTSGSATNIINIGGGTGLGNAATSVHVYAAANNTTTSGSEVVRFTPSGMSFDSGTTFIDNYETGDWDPVIEGDSTAGTQTYSGQVGRYTIIGNKVTVAFRAEMSAKDGTTAGNIQIGGLPFTVANDNANRCGVTWAAIGNTTFSTIPVGYANLGTSKIYLSELTSGAGSSRLVAADITATTNLRGSLTYFV